MKFKTTGKTVSTNAEDILRENSQREYLLIQNGGSQTAHVAFGETLGRAVSTTTGIYIASGGSYEMTKEKGNLSTDKVYATAATANTAMLVTEGVADDSSFAAFDPIPAGASSSSSSSSSSSPSSASSASSDSSSSSST